MCRSGAQRQDGRVEDVRERQTLGRERRNAVLRGNRQKAVSRDAEGGVMVEAAPAAAFEMPEPDLLLQLLIFALDAPAQLGQLNHALEADVFGQGEPAGRLSALSAAAWRRNGC